MFQDKAVDRIKKVSNIAGPVLGMAAGAVAMLADTPFIVEHINGCKIPPAFESIGSVENCDLVAQQISTLPIMVGNTLVHISAGFYIGNYASEKFKSFSRNKEKLLSNSVKLQLTNAALSAQRLKVLFPS